MPANCIDIDLALLDFWKGIYAVNEIAKADPDLRQELISGNTRELVEEAIQCLFPDKDKFEFPDSWSICFDECFEHFLIMPDEVGEVMLVLVPLPKPGSSKLDSSKPPKQGKGRDRLKRILTHPVGAGRTVADEMYEAAADCGYGCHSETGDSTIPSTFNRRAECNAP